MTPNFSTSQAMSSEQLTQLGKTAAHMSEMAGLSLTDAVVRSIGMTKLNEQQVRRVVESANHEAFHRKFSSMDPDMRVVELDGGPADPNEVLERLMATAAPTKVSGMNDDYRMAPRYSAKVSAPAGMSKEAALRPVLELTERLQASHDELVGHLAARQADTEVAVQKLAHLTRQAVSEGAFYEDFERAWGAISPKTATEMLSVLRPPRAPDGVKTASRRIADSAPVLTAFATFVKTSAAYEVACEAVRSIEHELIKVDNFLRSAR